MVGALLWTMHHVTRSLVHLKPWSVDMPDGMKPVCQCQAYPRVIYRLHLSTVISERFCLSTLIHMLKEAMPFVFSLVHPTFPIVCTPHMRFGSHDHFALRP